MADAKITALTALAAASVDDIFPVVDDPAGTPVTKKITYANLIGSFGAVGQLPFPATQIPSATANTLDDYEEGTWTPAPAFATPGTSSWASPTATGLYTKVGRLVTLTWYYSATLTKGTGSSYLVIPSPFVAAAGQAFWNGAGSMEAVTLANSGSLMSLLVQAESKIYYYLTPNNGTAGAYATAAMMTNGVVYLYGTISHAV